MSLLYAKVLSVINKGPQERTDAEIEQLLPWFRKKSELFKTSQTEVVCDIIKNCQFTNQDRDTVIIRQGDKGDCFYIILSGSVVIYINTNLSDEENRGDTDELDASEDDDSDRMSNSHRSESSFKSQRSRKNLARPILDTKKKELDRSRFGNYIGKIDAGKSFGELALINADCIRNATIMADEGTDLLVVNRDLYNRSLRSCQEKEFEEKKRFVAGFSFFAGWQQKYKKQISMSIRKEKITFGEAVVKQGSHVNGLCFLLSGQAKTVMDPMHHPAQYQSWYPLPDLEELAKVEARENLRREMELNTPRVNGKKIVMHNRKSLPVEIKHSRKKQHISRSVEICLIEPVEVIGDLELTMGLPTHAHTVICTQEAEVFILDQQNYDRLIEKRNPQTVDRMRFFLQEKLDLRLSWHPEKEFPLLRYLSYKLDERERLKARNNKFNRHSKRNWKIEDVRRGPCIDMYGPGSLYYSIKMRERNRQHTLSVISQPPGFTNYRRPIHTEKPKYPPMRSFYELRAALKARLVQGQEEQQKQNGDFITEQNEKATQIICESGFLGEENECNEDEYRDWASSDCALAQLEKRIQAWHERLDTDNRHLQRTVKLKRFLPAYDEAPKPGRTVHVRRREDKDNVLDSPMSSRVDVSRSCFDDRNSVSGDERAGMTTKSKTDILDTAKLIKRQHKPAKRYTIEEYEALKEEVSKKHREMQKMLKRPHSAFM